MMRRAKIVAAGVVLTFAIAGGWAWGGVKGSKHDFSGQSWTKDDLCGVCHSPHHDQPPKAAPLWNQGADLSKRFGLPVAWPGGPGPGTRICLQCHDGTVARDRAAGFNPRGQSPAARSPYVNRENPGMFGLGHDSTDHPVGIEYPRFDKGFRPAVSVISTGAGVALPDGKVECISCHDPHNTSGVAPMLVRSNARSALCLTCHRK